MRALATIGSAREAGRVRRHLRIRKRVVGTAERPRLVVHRSHLHFYAQVVDDLAHRTLLMVGTTAPAFRQRSAQGSTGPEHSRGGTVKAAALLGELVADEASARGIRQVAFDRGGYLYHGRVQAFAEAARQHGLVF